MKAKSTRSSQAAFYFHDFWRLANIFHQACVWEKTSFAASAVLSPIKDEHKEECILKRCATPGLFQFCNVMVQFL
jgi:hypothetical protein